MDFPRKPSPLIVCIAQSTELLYTRPLPHWSVAWFIMRAFTTSAGVPIMAPTKLSMKQIVRFQKPKQMYCY